MFFNFSFLEFIISEFLKLKIENIDTDWFVIQFTGLNIDEEHESQKDFSRFDLRPKIILVNTTSKSLLETL